MIERLRYDEVRARARNQWGAILADLAPDLRPALEKPTRSGPCPVHGGKDGFRFFRNWEETGGGICNTCVNPNTGNKGFHDGFEILCWINKYSRKDALREVADWLGGVRAQAPVRQKSPEEIAREKAEKEKDDEELRVKLRRAWKEAIPATVPGARSLRLYLTNRGLSPESIPVTLKMHPGMPFWHEGKKIGTFPAMLALMQTPDGRALTIHRTYITTRGQKAPAPDGKAKKLMPYPGSGEGIATGAAIRLFPAAKVLGLTEGIETALAVRQATGMAVWSCYSDTLLEKVVLPPEVEEVWIWADLDRKEAGQTSAEVLRKRLEAEGRRVHLCLPNGPIPEGKKGVDWLDVLNEQGPSAFPVVFRRQKAA